MFSPGDKVRVRAKDDLLKPGQVAIVKSVEPGFLRLTTPVIHGFTNSPFNSNYSQERFEYVEGNPMTDLEQTLLNAILRHMQPFAELYEKVKQSTSLLLVDEYKVATEVTYGDLRHMKNAYDEAVKLSEKPIVDSDLACPKCGGKVFECREG